MSKGQRKKEKHIYGKARSRTATTAHYHARQGHGIMSKVMRGIAVKKK